MSDIGSFSLSQPERDELYARAQLTSSLNPAMGSDPAALTANLDTSSSVEDWQSSTAQASNTITANARAAQLKELPHKQAKQVWDKMTTDQQTQVKAAGFVEPWRAAHGLWGWTQEIASDVTKVGMKGLNELGAPLRGVQQLYRFGEESTGLGGGGILQSAGRLAGGLQSIIPGGGGVGSAIGTHQNIHDTWNAWKAAGDSSHQFVPAAVRNASRSLNDNAQDLTLAKEIAARKGTAPDEVIADLLNKQGVTTDTPEFRQQFADMATRIGTDQFKTAVRQLRGGWLSPGRDFARTLGLQPGSLAYNIESGAGDAAFDIEADPLLAAGKLHSASMAVRLGIAGADDAYKGLRAGEGVYDLASRARDLTALDTLAAGQRSRDIRDGLSYMNGINALKVSNTERAAIMASDAFATGGEAQAQLASQMRGGAGMLSSLNRMRNLGMDIETPGDVFKAYEDAIRTGSVAKGEILNAMHRGDFLPMVSKFGSYADVAGAKFTEAVDFRNAEYMKDLANGKASRFLNLGNTSAKILHDLGAYVPKGGQEIADSRQATETFQKILKIGGLYPEEQRTLLGQWLEQAGENENLRKMTFDTALDKIFTHAGLDPTVEGSWAHRQISSGDYGIESMVNGHPAAIGPGQLSSVFHIPDFAEFYAQVSKLHGQNFLGSIINGDVMSSLINRAWKPMAVLRFGFIPRAFGEEGIQAAMRYGLGFFPRSYASAIAMPELAAQEAGVASKVGKGWDLADHMVDGLLNGFVYDPETVKFGRLKDQYNMQLLGRLGGVAGTSREVMANHFSQLMGMGDNFTKAGAIKYLETMHPEHLEAMRALVRHNPSAPYAYIDAVSARHLVQDGQEKAPNYPWLRQSGDGVNDPAHLEVRKINWHDNRVYTEGDIENQHAWHLRLKQAVNDPSGAQNAGFGALALHISPELASRYGESIPAVRDAYEQAPQWFQDRIGMYFATTDPAEKAGHLASARSALDQHMSGLQADLLDGIVGGMAHGHITDSDAAAMLLSRHEMLGLPKGADLTTDIEPDIARLIDRAEEGDFNAAKNLGVRRVYDKYVASPDVFDRLERAHVLPDGDGPGLPVVSELPEHTTRLYVPLGEDGQPLERQVSASVAHIHARMEHFPQGHIGYVDVPSNKLPTELADWHLNDLHVIDPDLPIHTVGDVMANGVSKDVVREDAAGAWMDYASKHARDPNGDVMHGIARSVADRSYSWDHLAHVARKDIPEVTGPAFTSAKRDIIQRITDKGFGVVGTALNAMIRQPLYLEGWARSWGSSESLLQELRDLPAEARVKELADHFEATDGYLRAMVDHSVSEQHQLASLVEHFGATDDEVMGLLRDPVVTESGIPEMTKQWNSLSDEDRSMLIRWKNATEKRDGIRAAWAHDRAIAEVIPYINDHNVKSQFATRVRNLSPFFWSQESFLRRWGRTMQYAPETIRRAQLYLNGVEHSGFTHRNEQGDSVFTMPGAGLTAHGLSLISSFLGADAALPVTSPLTGELRMLTPGYDRLGPSTGPLISIPLNALARKFPELQPVAGTVLGPAGTGRSVPEQLIPSSVMRFYHAFADNPKSSEQYASAMVSAMRYAEAHNDPGLAVDATPHQRQALLDRVENHTRVVLLTRAIMGFMGPEAPKVDVGKLPTEYTNLLKYLPVHEATAIFLKRHPNGTAATIFPTHSVSGAPLPTTEAAYQAIADHGTFFDNYKDAGAWLLPQDKGDAFSRRAYLAELSAGLRERRSPAEWLDQFSFARSAPDYFATLEGHQRRMAAASGNSQQRYALEAAFQDWKQRYFEANPVFGELLSSGQGHQRRIQTLTEMRKALADPDVPQVGQLAQMRDLMATFNGYADRKRQLNGQHSAGARLQNRNEDVAFANWITAYVAKNPQLEAFYNTVIRPELAKGDITQGVGAMLAAGEQAAGIGA